MTTITTDTITRTYNRPFLYKQQKEAIFDPARYVIIEASTKSGKTAGCMAWIIEQALINGRVGRNYWWVAPVFSQAKMVHRRLKRAIPRVINQYPLYKANEAELSITLDNGAVIVCKSGDNPDSLYGEDVYGAVIDEATRCREEAWYALRTTLTSTGGSIRIIGNVKGRRNWAYQMARKAESGQPDWHYARITAYDAIKAGLIPNSEVDDARKALPQNIFQELYEAIPSDDGGNPFGLDAIRDCIGGISNEPPTHWGWDLARSEDYTWGVALDSQMRVCRNVRFQKSWTETIRDITNLVGDTPALADATGVGDAVVEDLQRNLPRMEGFKFTAQSKQNLMERLSIAIAGREIRYPDGMLVSELESFEYEYTRTGVKYSAPTGLHDDGVMALALAVYHATHAPTIGVW